MNVTKLEFVTSVILLVVVSVGFGITLPILEVGATDAIMWWCALVLFGVSTGVLTLLAAYHLENISNNNVPF